MGYFQNIETEREKRGSWKKITALSLRTTLQSRPYGQHFQIHTNNHILHTMLILQFIQNKRQ